MRTTKNQNQIQIGDNVETKPGVDGADAGVVLDSRPGEVLVGWESGARTWTPVADLVVVPAGRQSRYGADHGLPCTE